VCVCVLGGGGVIGILNLKIFKLEGFVEQVKHGGCHIIFKNLLVMYWHVS
jgi:hypothetical protein